MKPLQKALHSSIDDLPRVVLVKLLAPKLKAARIRDYRRKAEALATHLLTTGEDTFSWGDDDKRENLIISFTDEDHRELERISAKFIYSLKDLIPKLTIRSRWRFLIRSRSSALSMTLPLKLASIRRCLAALNCGPSPASGSAAVSIPRRHDTNLDTGLALPLCREPMFTNRSYRDNARKCPTSMSARPAISSAL
jgi:hypothetical protein